MFFKSLCNKFIRPSRANYSKSHLGPKTFLLKNEILVNRYDFTLSNKDSHTIVCSLYEAEEHFSLSSCVIYLHCNTGSRLDVKPYLNELIAQGFSVCSFDFSGCGLSGGDYISLGYKEQYDLELVLDYLKDLRRYEYFFLWGRSMGAVTALLYLANTQQNLIKGMLIDSGFFSLRRMVLEYASEITNIPEILLYPLIPLVNKLLKDRINLGFDDFELKDQLNYLKFNRNQCVPEVLFIASKRDRVVKFSHSEELLRFYPGKNKSIKYIYESHEEDRSGKVVRECVEFLMKVREKLLKEDIIKDRFTNQNCFEGRREMNSERIKRIPAKNELFNNFGKNQKSSFEVLSNNVYINNNKNNSLY